MKKVVIGIQARSTSNRLPNKIEALIGKKTCLQHTIDACFNSSVYLNRQDYLKAKVEVFLLIPQNDPIRARYANQIPIIEGPEENVLARYHAILDKVPADYICRITGDCPMIPHFLISKMISIAIQNQYDYVSNVEERCRTTADGMDCEVFSRRALDYVFENAKTQTHQEHVTTYLRTNCPNWLQKGTVINFLDLSKLKLSVDTEADLEEVRNHHESIEGAYRRAVEIFGKSHVHRF